MSRLVVVSNRIALPDDKKSSAGGLAVGILGALRAAGGLWFGWSGKTARGASGELREQVDGDIRFKQLRRPAHQV